MRLYKTFANIYQKNRDTLVLETNFSLLFPLILCCYQEPILLKHLNFSIEILIVKGVLYKYIT